MKVFWSVNEVLDSLTDGALAIGNFDGVHLGHQALIKKIIGLKGNKACGVLTFSPHPSTILKKGLEHFYLSTDDEKLETLARLHVDVAIVQKIDEAFLGLSAEAFVNDIIVRKLKVKHVVVGEDFSFGYRALGNVALLSSLGKLAGFTTHAIVAVKVDGARCSSTGIRTHLRNGDVARANAMLGRHYSLCGRVLAGQKIGRVMGFKTANLSPPAEFQLGHGVYATVTRVFSGLAHKDYLSATNVGIRPTVSAENICLVETHILQEEIDLYDQFIQIFFVERLRLETKFSSLEELKEQIQRDCDVTRQLESAQPTRFHIKD